jgi:hypothetical protein
MVSSVIVMESCKDRNSRRRRLIRSGRISAKPQIACSGLTKSSISRGIFVQKINSSQLSNRFWVLFGRPAPWFAIFIKAHCSQFCSRADIKWRKAPLAGSSAARTAATCVNPLDLLHNIVHIRIMVSIGLNPRADNLPRQKH